MPSEHEVCNPQGCATNYSAIFGHTTDPERGIPPAQPLEPSCERFPVLVLLASCFCFAMMEVFARQVVHIYKTSLIFVTFYTGLASAVMSQLALFSLKQPIFTSRSPLTLALVLARSIFGALSLILEYAAVRHLPIGIVTCLYSLNIIMTSLLGWIFLNEQLTRLNYIVLCIVTSGAVFVGMAEPISFTDITNQHHLQGVIYSLLMGLSFSVVFVIMRGLGEEAHFIGTELTASICLSALSIVWYYAEHGGSVWKFFAERMLTLNVKTHIAILGISFCNFAGALLFNYSVRRMRAEKSSVIMTSDIPMSFICGFLFLGEFPKSLFEIIGCLLIAIGAYVSAMGIKS